VILDKNARGYVRTGLFPHPISTISHNEQSEILRSNLRTNLQDISEDLDEPVQKKLKLDTNRTGAKCVKGEIEDPLGSGTEYHNIGVLRRKPGRGDPTLSLSCSDKLLKWNVIGFQVSAFF